MHTYSEKEVQELQENIEYIDEFYDCVCFIFAKQNTLYEKNDMITNKKEFNKILDFFNDRLKFSINDRVRNFLSTKFECDIGSFDHKKYLSSDKLVDYPTIN